MENRNNLEHYFYQGSKLSTVQSTNANRTIFRKDVSQLADTSNSGEADARLLATDESGTVLHIQNHPQNTLLAFTSYGYSSNLVSSGLVLGFNGERNDNSLGGYLLGNGYRTYAPSLMRFFCPDSISPFGKGGINAYGYCAGDPINRHDPSGHLFGWIRNSSGRNPLRPPKGKHGAFAGFSKAIDKHIKIAEQMVTTELPSYNQAVARYGNPFTPEPRYSQIPRAREITRSSNLKKHELPAGATPAQSTDWSRKIHSEITQVELRLNSLDVTSETSGIEYRKLLTTRNELHLRETAQLLNMIRSSKLN